MKCIWILIQEKAEQVSIIKLGKKVWPFYQLSWYLFNKGNNILALVKQLLCEVCFSMKFFIFI